MNNVRKCFYFVFQNSRVEYEDDDDLTSQIKGMGLNKASPAKAKVLHTTLTSNSDNFYITRSCSQFLPLGWMSF